MPAIVIERQECKEEMWKSLKRHIIRSRQKKKEEQEADEAEERQRRNREEQERQDRMTLGETRQQIKGLEEELAKLRDEKHQLFLQLKKVLNEDETRRRLNSRVENSDIVQPYPTVVHLGSGSGSGHQQQLFLQHNPQTHLQTRQVYKVNHLQGTTLLAPQEVVEDSRRGLGEYGGRAVLWNKNHAYGAAPGFYPTHHPGTVYAVHSATHLLPSMHTAAPPQSTAAADRERERERERERDRELRESRERAREAERERERDDTPVSKPGGSAVQYIGQTRGQTYALHSIDQDKYYAVRSTNHVPIHGGAIPIQQPSQGAKTGSITSGYPVRSPAPPQPQHASPHASPQPRATTFQPAGPIINPQQLNMYSQRLAIGTPTTSTPSGLSHISSHPVSGHVVSHPVGHPVSHPSSLSSSHTSHSITYTTNHVSSHPQSHPSVHPSHSHALSHVTHNVSHVVSHSTGHPHPHQPMHHTSVLHSSHQPVHVNVSQGHQNPISSSAGRYTSMSNMPRES